MNILIRLVSWLILPCVLAVSAAYSNNGLALVAVSAMWGLIMIVCPLALLVAGAQMMVSFDNPKWKEVEEVARKNRRSFMASLVSWASLAVVVVLAAYQGFPVSACFYLVGSLFSRGCVWLILEHVKRENDKAVAA